MEFQGDWSQWDSNPQHFDCKSNALSSWSYDPISGAGVRAAPLGNNMLRGYAPFGPGERTRTSNASRHQGLNLAAIPIRLHPDMRAMLATPAYIIRETVC